MPDSTTMTHVRVRPIAGALGAEIDGIDLTQPITDDVYEAVHAALLEHQVIFFREQDITPAQQKALAGRFGPLQPHPAYPTVEGHPEVTILVSSRERPSKIEKWHTDMTFMERPPLGSLLHAQEIPPVGGDTEWASMTAAWEGLSDRMQRLLDGLEAQHSFAHGFRESIEETPTSPTLMSAVRANPPVQHPVVRTHPETGRKGLFVNCLFTTRILGMKERESRALLDFLYEHAVSPEYTCRFRWSTHALAFWDNRATQHRPVNDYFPEYRRMHRVTVAGDRPA